MGSESSESTDWQSTVRGVGIVEFVELENQEPFVERMNEYLDADEQLFRLSSQETHARVPNVRSGLQRELSLPDDYGGLFEEVHISPVTDTNRLARVLIYGVIDEETFRTKREATYEEMRDYLQLEHAGLEILRDAESELSEFVREEVGAGFFAEHAEDWAGRNEHEYGHPGFWFYDLASAGLSSLSEFHTRRHEETLFLGLGQTDRLECSITPYADKRCFANGDGGRYFTTPLGSFPFRYLLVRVQEPDEVEDPFGWEMPSPDTGIPQDFKAGYAPLAQSYVHLFWSLYSYFTLDDHEPAFEAYAPDRLLADDRGVRETLDSMTDAEKATLLDDLYDGNRALEDCWVTLQQQFESIKTTRGEWGGFATREESVARPLITAATDIESLCEDRVNRFERGYDRLIDRVQSHLEANVGIVGKQLSAILFALTLATIVIQLPAVLAGPYTRPILGTLLVIFGGILVILFDVSLPHRLRG